MRKWMLMALGFTAIGLSLAHGGEAESPGYKIPDPSHPGHSILQPGYQMTLAEMCQGSYKSRLRFIQTDQDLCSGKTVPLTKVVVQINRDGFRGPEIDSSPRRMRILMLGDSVTFGPPFEERPYPRRAEKILQEKGTAAEVINAGIDGISFSDILLNVEHLKALKPDIVTIFLGWNSLGSLSDVAPGVSRYRYFPGRLLTDLRNIPARLHWVPFSAPLQGASYDFRPDAPEVKQFKDWKPAFLSQLVEIINQFQAPGRKIVLITLPGFFTPDSPPSAPWPLAVSGIGDFSRNPYVWARLTENFNQSLRQLAQDKGLSVIDLEAWSRTALKPRENYFCDALHPNDVTQQKLAAYVAEALRRLTAGSPRR